MKGCFIRTDRKQFAEDLALLFVPLDFAANVCYTSNKNRFPPEEYEEDFYYG